MNSMIVIGATKETVAEARAAIMDIIRSAADPPTKVTALEVLRDLCQVKDGKIEGCTFTNNAAPRVAAISGKKRR